MQARGHRDPALQATIWLPIVVLMPVDLIFKALADPARRRLLDSLHHRNGQTLRELCAGHDMTRQAVTKHLGVLAAANLIATEKRGREKFHHLNPVPIREIADDWIGKYARSPLVVG